MPSLWKDSLEVTADMIRYKGCAGYAVARTGRKENPEALQGFHAETLCFFCDEASGIDDIVFQVAQGALSTKGARIIMAANPTRTSGYFFNAFHRDRERWERFTFSCLDSPHVSPSYAKEVEESYGSDSDIYRVRVLGDFPKSSDLQFIPSSVVDSSMGKHLHENEYKYAPIILGVDVARFGSDRSVIFMRQGLYSELAWQGRGFDTMSLADVVCSMHGKYKADAIMVDETGVGGGVVDRLRQLGYVSIFGVNEGSSSALKECLNKRAEMWWKMRDWLKEGGCIPDIPDLRDDLLSPEYQFNNKGLCQLEKKSDMKRRGLPSPDLADALALTFAYNVYPKRSKSIFQDVADDSFDLFSI